MSAPTATSTITAQAMRLLELSPISSFSDETETAAAVAEQYPDAMRQSLEAADWSFASVLADLPSLVLSIPVDPKMPHTFSLPADCVLLREIVDKSVRWRVDRGRVLRASAVAPLRVRYTGMISDENLLPASFRLAVSYRLASLLAPRFIGTATKIDRIEQSAAAAIKAAMRVDAGQASPVSYDQRTGAGDWASEAVR